MLTETARVEYAGRGVAFTCVMPSFTATELIAGTSGTRFVPTVAPDDVARPDPPMRRRLPSELRSLSRLLEALVI